MTPHPADAARAKELLRVAIRDYAADNYIAEDHCNAIAAALTAARVEGMRECIDIICGLTGKRIYVVGNEAILGPPNGIAEIENRIAELTKEG